MSLNLTAPWQMLSPHFLCARLSGEAMLARSCHGLCSHTLPVTDRERDTELSCLVPGSGRANANPSCLRPELCPPSGHVAITASPRGKSHPAAPAGPHLDCGKLLHLFRLLKEPRDMLNHWSCSLIVTALTNTSGMAKRTVRGNITFKV